MIVLVVINDAPYASERPHSALRLAMAFHDETEDAVRLFFLGDGVLCAVAGQTVPEDRHDIEWMLRRFLAKIPAGVSHPCMESRGIRGDQLIPGVQESSLSTLREWVKEAERVLIF